MKKIFLILLFCIFNLVCLNSVLYCLPWPPTVDLVSIKFNYLSGSTYDSHTLKENNSTSVHVPEWYTGSYNEEIAYSINQTNRKVKALFYFEEGFVVDTEIKATKISGSGLGGISTTCVPFDGHYSEETVMIINGSVPGSIGKRSFKWKWYLISFDETTFEEPLIIGTSGDHDYYTLLTSPQSPMQAPWVDVLEYACSWANGISNTSSAMSNIVEKIYDDAKFKYDVDDGSSRYTLGAGSQNFNLTQMLIEISDLYYSIVNCYDTGKAVKIFANALGCNAVYKYCYPFGYQNCIKPIGRDWTNNPFYEGTWQGVEVWTDPVVGEDTEWDPPWEKRSYFGNHAFGALGSNIYDACLKVDTDGNPDFTPCTETWATGWSWSTYVSKVVDNNPSTSTGSASPYSFSVY